MATTSVVWKEGMHFCTKVESGQLMCDESSEVGKAYPSAPELLMASLGSCIASVLVYFAQRHDIALGTAATANCAQGLEPGIGNGIQKIVDAAGAAYGIVAH